MSREKPSYPPAATTAASSFAAAASAGGASARKGGSGSPFTERCTATHTRVAFACAASRTASSGHTYPAYGHWSSAVIVPSSPTTSELIDWSRSVTASQRRPKSAAGEMKRLAHTKLRRDANGKRGGRGGSAGAGGEVGGAGGEGDGGGGSGGGGA